MKAEKIFTEKRVMELLEEQRKICTHNFCAKGIDVETYDLTFITYAPSPELTGNIELPTEEEIIAFANTKWLPHEAGHKAVINGANYLKSKLL